VITEILPSAFSVLGLPTSDPLGLATRIGPVRRIAVLLVDGLGYHQLPRAAESAPFLADVLAGRVGQLDELACTLPSTTPTSLVSLGTGVSPGEHGVLGFTVNIPGTDRVLTHILWGDDPPPASWQPVPTMYSRAAAAGIRSAVVLPAAFAGSGLTQAAYGGAEFVGLGDGDDLATTMLAALHAGPGLVFGYTARVDTAAHLHGIASPSWAAAAADAGVLIERLVVGLPPDAALLVTADHGGLDVPASSRFDLGVDLRLSAGVRVVAGEPRFRYLHTEAGAAADVVDAWRGVLGDRAAVLTRDEAVGSGIFGAVRAEHLARIGDVVVIANGDMAVLASGFEPPVVATLVGMHGARNREETAIPLISFPADNPLA
jgi:Type I phosphodiesterase / nucleotide pyrophosphatase